MNTKTRANRLINILQNSNGIRNDMRRSPRIKKIPISTTPVVQLSVRINKKELSSDSLTMKKI